MAHRRTYDLNRNEDEDIGPAPLTFEKGVGNLELNEASTLPAHIARAGHPLGVRVEDYGAERGPINRSGAIGRSEANLLALVVAPEPEGTVARSLRREGVEELLHFASLYEQKDGMGQPLASPLSLSSNAYEAVQAFRAINDYAGLFEKRDYRRYLDRATLLDAGLEHGAPAALDLYTHVFEAGAQELDPAGPGPAVTAPTDAEIAEALAETAEALVEADVDLTPYVDTGEGATPLPADGWVAMVRERQLDDPGLSAAVP